MHNKDLCSQNKLYHLPCPNTNMKVPMYVWVCRACGARWQRTQIDLRAANAHQAQSGGSQCHKSLQPSPSSSSGLKTRVKRERKPTDLPAQAVTVMIHAEEEELDNPTDPPRQE